MSNLHLGEKAPGFSLISSDKTEVQLSDYKGQNLLLLFFPFAFTGVCTKEMCQTQDDLAYYQGVNAQVIGISVDSPHTLNKFKELNHLTFTLLSDFNKTASKAYDCLLEVNPIGLKGVSKRAAFIVDREGMLRYMEILENPGNLPNFDAINQTLKSLN